MIFRNISKINNQDNVSFNGEIIQKPPKYIEDLVKKLSQANSRKQMYEILDDTVEKTSDFISVDDTCYVGSGYRFQCTLQQYADKYDIKKINRESNIKIIKIIPIANSDRCVIVSKAK